MTPKIAAKQAAKRKRGNPASKEGVAQKLDRASSLPSAKSSGSTVSPAQQNKSAPRVATASAVKSVAYPLPDSFSNLGYADPKGRLRKRSK